ncbi:hypothetical protein V6Z11_A01G191300 [Gossypium hirsutum]
MKVVFLHSSTDCNENIMLALFGYFVEGSTFMMFGENKKIVLENVGDLRILSHLMGRTIVIDPEGRTIVIDPCLNVSFLTHVECFRTLLIHKTGYVEMKVRPKMDHQKN